MININKSKIAVIGLGYVGLPLAVEFGKFFETIGFDIDKSRVKQLEDGKDLTLEVETKELIESVKLTYSSDTQDISNCNIFIITVPTPLDDSNDPDLYPLTNATETVSRFLKVNDIVIYESTVYPGATEEVCVPILEKNSGLEFNKDFFCGYSPERINPGDKEHRLKSIIKVTSGSTIESAEIIDNLYKKIILAGTYQAESIKVAEAAKVIENTQRDVNIALINELSQIFNKLDIDTESVLKAASTKWNFLKFKPGIVGGHCISVDPYYLVYKSKTLGYTPKVILSGREVNEKIGLFICNKVINLLKKNNVSIKGSKSLILGITFKENCPDIRNSKVIEIYNYLISKGVIVDLHDPHANRDEVKNKLGVNLLTTFEKYDSIILAVPHDHYKSLNFNNFKRNANSILYDVKGLLPKSDSNGRL